MPELNGIALQVDGGQENHTQDASTKQTSKRTRTLTAKARILNTLLLEIKLKRERRVRINKNATIGNHVVFGARTHWSHSAGPGGSATASDVRIDKEDTRKYNDMWDEYLDKKGLDPEAEIDKPSTIDPRRVFWDFDERIAMKTTESALWMKNRKEYEEKECSGL